MRILSSKTLLGVLTATALLGGAFISTADAAGTSLVRGGHGAPSAATATGALPGSIFGGSSTAFKTPRDRNSDNAFGGPTEGSFTPDSGATASAEESCLVQQPIVSHGRVIGHRWVNAC